MELTIIIVNYNVRFFLEQCLLSILKASGGIDPEIVVVDNNSTDGSCSMLKNKFPYVRLIENKRNLGFSRANNQGLRIAKGRYCLLLNPDTLVEEDTFRKCLRFMDDNPDAGALGVKMIDGRGNFLPESKRSLPTPSVAFFKIFGFSRFFPKSVIFSRYNLGYLDNNQTHEVDVLSGAFMLIRKAALNKTGLLDEDFFMYGEDIDISFRLSKAGYKNYYFPETTIIHYKGESTKKGSINYVLVFYKAMIIFAKKHFTRKNAAIFSFLIHMAIYFRASLAIIRRFTEKTYQPLIDALLIYAGFFLITQLWEQFRFGTRMYFPDLYYYYIVPGYILTYIISVYYSGGYEKPLRLWNLVRGFLSGALIILVIYALLPENLRFSRVVILLGTIWGIPALLLHRLFMSFFNLKDYKLALGQKRKIIIAGKKKESERVAGILLETDPDIDIAGFISPQDETENVFIGTIDQLRDAVIMHKADEIIFCANDIPSNEIISQMSVLSDLPVEFKIAPPGSSAIIGSKSIKASGDLYLVAFNSIGTPASRRNKRLFDVISSLVIIFSSPVLLFTLPSFSAKMLSAFKVLAGFRTWVGYVPEGELSHFPFIRKPVYTLTDGLKTIPSKEYITALNSEYARDYKLLKDFNVIRRNLIKT